MLNLLTWSANGDLLRVWEIPEQAARSWIESKLQDYWDRQTVRAELKERQNVLAVYEKTPAGEIIQTADENGDTEMAEEAQDVGPENEGETATERKTKKWERVRDALKDKPTTIAEISDMLGINENAARSYIGDLRTRGYKVAREKDADGNSVYKVID